MTTHEVMIEPGARNGEITTTIDGERRAFELGTEKVSARLLTEPNDRLLDLLEIAGGVFAADGAIRRGPDQRPEMGARWRRSFLIHAQVRQPEFWRRSEVSDALGDLVDVMSEDTAEFEFARAKSPPPFQRYVPLEEGDGSGPVEDVIMFSGGLDSLAGAIETLETREGRVALVTHLSSQKRMPMQRELAGRLVSRYGARVLPVPLMARRKGGRRFPETTQRTRTLLFGAIGALVHEMLGGRRVSFFENGVVSQNLPISPQVIGSMATRTTHPAVMEHLQRLLALVCDQGVDLRTPYEWLTKTDVVQRLERYKAVDLIPQTFSCSSVFDRSVEAPHCGVCSQCLDRRVAILACGLADYDPVGGYDTDALSGERFSDRDAIMAVEWIRHAYRMKDLTPAELAARFGLEISRIVSGFPSRSADDVMADTVEMQRRHGLAVEMAVTQEVRDRAGDIARGALPSTAPILMLSPTGEPARASSSRPVPRADRRDPPELPLEAKVFPLQVRIRDGRKSLTVEVEGIGAVRGAHGRVIVELHPYHEADRAAGKSREAHRFVSAGEIADHLGRSPNAVWSAVKRCRGELKELFEIVFGAPPEGDLLIHSPRSGRGGGYRLDPDCRVVTARDD